MFMLTHYLVTINLRHFLCNICGVRAHDSLMRVYIISIRQEASFKEIIYLTELMVALRSVVYYLGWAIGNCWRTNSLFGCQHCCYLTTASVTVSPY